MEPTRPPVHPPDRPTFERELETLINKYTLEQGSNTPDFILALFLGRCLQAWNEATTTRERWYGRAMGDPQPLPSEPPPPIKGKL